MHNPTVADLLTDLIHSHSREAWPKIIAARLEGNDKREALLIAGWKEQIRQDIGYYTSVHPEWRAQMDFVPPPK